MLKKVLVTGCVVLLLSACGTSTEDGSTIQENKSSTDSTSTETNRKSESNVPEDMSSVSNTSTVADIMNPTVSLTDAVNIFHETYPNAEIHKVYFDSDSGHLHYEIDGFDSSKEYEVEINATTEEITKNKVETENDKDEALDFSAIIDLEEAIETASLETVVEGLSPTGWSLEADDHMQKYTIEYDDRHSDIEIEIDAITGEILEIDVDD